MSAGTSSANKDSLVSALEEAGTKAFEPTAEPASRAEGQREFGALISRTGTSALISALNALIKPDRVPAWLRIRLMDVLTLLPQRPDGVRATLEFVFSVHPSSTVRASEAATPQKQGANITMEALKMASNLLSVPPASVGPEKWFPGIAPQLLRLLDGNDGADLAKVASYVIGFGILGRKQFGAPGTPGWKAFAEPMLAQIDPVLSSEAPISAPLVFSAGPDEVVDLRKEVILVQPDELHVALARLSSLLNTHPNPGLTKRLLYPLILPLWALSTWPFPGERLRERYCKPARDLLEIYLRLAASQEILQNLLDNLLFRGNDDPNKGLWAYEKAGEYGIQIKSLRDEPRNMNKDLDLATLESKTDAFVELLKKLGSDTDISTLFLRLFEDSLRPSQAADDIKMVLDDDQNQDEDPMAKLVEARVLQKLMERLPDRLISDSKHLLELVSKILSKFDASSSATVEDATAIALSLLNIVVTAPSFQRSDADSSVLASIEASLEKVSRAGAPETRQTARNLSLLLQYRDAVDDPSDHPTTAPTDRQREDRRTYDLAMSYITGADSPPPVRSEGLNLLAGLARSGSPVLDIPATLALLSSLLLGAAADDDDYLAARVMRVFVSLSERHPRSTTAEILEHYGDASEAATLDARLRFGEALLQVVQRLGATFAGDTASAVGSALLALAGRRPQRPKTAARRDRAARARKPPATADEDEADDDLLEPRTAEERARDEALARILSSWASPRDATGEDLRVRASALSVLAACIETNVSGLGGALVSASVDLCLDVLTLETGAGILRRAAVLLLLELVRALAAARDRGQDLGFGFGFGAQAYARAVDVLGYLARTDDDGLVRQHARDCLESLESWRLVELMPRGEGEGMVREGAELTRLVGLGDRGRVTLPRLEPEREGEGTTAREYGGVMRPRIEEVE
ncbi:hypothetical protein F4775DRAFT_597331 [Biscogniauxia sp. FL1348]|nr:hypothetical protein F4775DRAFT_597331 [Biscogniauxia sp. FL1348]